MLRAAVPGGFPVILCLISALTAMAADAGEPRLLQDALIFHAPFDESLDAIRGTELTILTAEDSSRKSVQPGNHRSDVSLVDGGRYGKAVRFADSSKQVLFYRGSNLQYQPRNWSGTVSFWLRADPEKGLKPGYCDPIQMTQKAWNDSAFWVDFDKDPPRAFRLGAFSEFSRWNPQKLEWDRFPVDQRPMIPVARPAFSGRLWTHTAFTFENVNAADGSDAVVSLYLHGIHQGTLKRPLTFEWNVDEVAVMLGLSYVGDMDDLAVFNRALTADEVEELRTLPKGIAGLPE